MTEETTPPDIKAGAAPPDNVSSVKRGRGRPRGSTSAPLETAIPGGTTQARSAGGRFGAKAAPTPVDIPTLAKQLKGVHQMGAMMLGLPMLVLSDPEAVMLAEGFAAVAREYDLSISGKTGATLQLLAAAAVVYVPRMIAVDVYIKQKKASARANSGNPSNVVDMATGEPLPPVN
jgi:hypothetical protein